MLRMFRQGGKTPISDEELVAQWTKGADKNALGTLYERYMPLLYGICLKYLRDSMTAEDAVMQVYEQVERKLASSDVQNFKSWACTVARNHCLMQLRKDKNVHIEHVDPTDAWQFDSPDDGLLSTDATEREQMLISMERCLDVLARVQQQAVQMFYLEGKSYQQISDATGAEIGAVRSSIQNGRRNLRNCMEQGISYQ